MRNPEVVRCDHEEAMMVTLLLVVMVPSWGYRGGNPPARRQLSIPSSCRRSARCRPPPRHAYGGQRNCGIELSSSRAPTD